MNQEYTYKVASLEELERRWDKNITDNIEDTRWVRWKSIALENHKTKKCVTFLVVLKEDPIGEGSLVFLQQGVEINGLRIDKAYEGKGHISKLVKIMEKYAKNEGYDTAIIGVEPKETRNLAIYLHWGYIQFERLTITDFHEEEGLVLYYSKSI